MIHLHVDYYLAGSINPSCTSFTILYQMKERVTTCRHAS